MILRGQTIERKSEVRLNGSQHGGKLTSNILRLSVSAQFVIMTYYSNFKFSCFSTISFFISVNVLFFFLLVQPFTFSKEENAGKKSASLIF